MSDALRSTGRPIVFSLCEWGNNKPWLWAQKIGNLWRSTGDITDKWSGKHKYSWGLTNIVDINEPLWTTQFGDKRSLRQIARDVAWYFRRSIRRFSDPFSFRLLFAILSGRAASMLELVSMSRDSATAETIAPPSPWTARAATNCHSVVATANQSRPAAAERTPRMRWTLPSTKLSRRARKRSSSTSGTTGAG